MKYDVKLGKSFKKDFKWLMKKYRNISDDLNELIGELEINPNLGTDLGNGVRKVRMAISDKGKGKSHGARVITHTAVISVEEGIITLLAIYDKAEQKTITAQKIAELLKTLEE